MYSVLSTQYSVLPADEWDMTKPLSPEESLKAMHVRPGMKIELVAAEPLWLIRWRSIGGRMAGCGSSRCGIIPSGITWNKEGDEFGKPGGRVKVLTMSMAMAATTKPPFFSTRFRFPPA